MSALRKVARKYGGYKMKPYRKNNLSRRVRKLEKASKEEFKFSQLGGSQVFYASSVGQVVHLTGLAEGPAVNQREGQSIKLWQIRLRGHINLHASAATDPQLFRVCIVQDMMNDGTAPTYANVFSNQGVMNYKNKTSLRGRFKILLDRHVEMHLSGTGVGVDNIPLIDYTKRFKSPIKIEYDGTAATNHGKNNVYMLLNTIDTTNISTLVWTSEIRYTE